MKLTVVYVCMNTHPQTRRDKAADFARATCDHGHDCEALAVMYLQRGPPDCGK
jgi:hypothetical protein